LKPFGTSQYGIQFEQVRRVQDCVARIRYQSTRERTIHLLCRRDIKPRQQVKPPPHTHASYSFALGLSRETTDAARKVMHFTNSIILLQNGMPQARRLRFRRYRKLRYATRANIKTKGTIGVPTPLSIETLPFFIAISCRHYRRHLPPTFPTRTLHLQATTYDNSSKTVSAEPQPG
jgi:hypothetical protein